MTASWIQSGKPENLSEERVFKHLQAALPDDYTLLSNPSVTDERGVTHELDAILLGRHAIYVLEIKNWGGKMRGDAFYWSLPQPGGAPGLTPSTALRASRKPSPLVQVERQVKVLATQLKAYDKRFRQVFVQGCVVMAADEPPDLSDVEDNPGRLKKVQWYQGVEKFLTSESALTIPANFSVETGDITAYHPAAQKAIQTGFAAPLSPAAPRAPEQRGAIEQRIGRYIVQGVAWESRRYRALFGKARQGYPSECLLKVYPIPAEVPDGEIGKFVSGLQRDLYALRLIRERGNALVGVQQNVVMGVETIPLHEKRQYVVVIERVKGKLLSHLIQDSEKLSLHDQYDIAAQLCRGLAFAHSAGVVHRNLTPENIVWSDERVAKIINFDYAKFMDPSIPVGTISVSDVEDSQLIQRYLSPELTWPTHYHHANQSTDIYALGLILWEMFAGALPPAGQDFDPALLWQADPEIDASVGDLLATFCARAPEDRTRISLAQAAAVFQNLAEGLPAYPEEAAPHPAEVTPLGWGVLGGLAPYIPDFARGTVFNDRYKVFSLLADSDQSKVFLARDLRDGGWVVVKFLRSARAKAEQEIENAYAILSQIDSAYTARWLDQGKIAISGGKLSWQPTPVSAGETAQSQVLYYQVLEYIDGETLKESLSSRLPDPGAALEMMVNILEAVCAVHRVGWIHRDIKPSNFILTPDGRLKIIDFGVSRRVREAGRTVVGTMGYIPPEVVVERKPWSMVGDLYSVAGTFAALLCGEEQTDENGPRRDYDLIRQRVGPEICQLIEANSSASPEDRCQSAEQMLADLNACIEKYRRKGSIVLLLKNYHDREDFLPQSSRRSLRNLENSADSAISAVKSLVAAGGRAMNDIYRKAIEDLKKMANKQKLLGKRDKWAALEKEAQKLSAWLEGGQAGECPVDLAALGLAPAVMEKRAEPEAAAVTEKAAPPPEEAAPAEIAPPPQPEPLPVEPEVAPQPVVEVTPAEVTVVAQPPVVAEVPPEEPAVVVKPEKKPRRGNGRAKEKITAKTRPEELGLLEEVLPGEELVIEIETPEESQLRRQLEEAKASCDQGKFREAAALSQIIRDRAKKGSPLEQDASQLYSLSQRRLSDALEDTIQQGDDARANGQEGEARRHYQAALALDPENEHARRALLDLDHYLTAQLSEAERVKLRSGLKERKDLNRLGEAVYRAEALDAEGKLTGERGWQPTLVALLREARQAYDEIRATQGEETTMMRFADLTGRKVARDRIAERVAKGEKQIFDVTINQLKEAFVVLQEADKLYEQYSQDTAQYEIERLNKSLPAHPLWARRRLEEALAKPFFEYHRRLLEEKQRQVEELIAKQEQAETLLVQSEESEEPLKTLGFLLQAEKVFPYLEGLAERIEQARQTAASTAATRMANHHKQAGAYLKAEDFQAARAEVGKADALPALWPEETKPQALLDLLEASAHLCQRIDDREALRQEFDTRVAAIRAQIPNPDRRQAGLTLFRELREDPRFAGFTDLRVLVSEMDNYSDLGEQLAEARITRTQGDWERVYELTEKIKRSGKAAQYAAEVDGLFEEAHMQLAIANARQHLEKDEIVEANKTLSKLINTMPSEARKDELRARLKSELDKIQQCANDNPPMQALFDRAKGLRDKKGAAERMEALRLFRYVGGEIEHRGEMGPDEKELTWPNYALSLRTAEARRRAQELSQELRAELLPPLQEAYQARQTVEQDENKLALLDERASALRKAHLLESEDERAIVRWVEVTWGSWQARLKEQNGDWDGAVTIWHALDKHHPRLSNVENNLRHARLFQAITHAEALLRQGQGEQALAVLSELQQDPALNRAWPLYLTLADIHADLGYFDKAFGAMSEAERLWAARLRDQDIARLTDEEKARLQGERAQLQARRQALVREQEIQRAIAQARNEWQGQANGAKEALRILQTALGKEPTRDSRRLRELREQIFNEAKHALLKTAGEEKVKSGDEGKIKAVVALVDLGELEELTAQPESERRSAAELKPLRAQLASVAESVTREAQDFDPSALPLERALAEADKLNGRLQTFSSVTRLFGAELGVIKERLEKRRVEMAATYEALKRLQASLGEALAPQLWEEALLKDHFEPLEKSLRQVKQLDLDIMSEVKNLEQRLDEWRDMHAYLSGEITAIRKKFSVEEDFEMVVIALRRLNARPEARPNNQPWRQIQQKEYEAIRKVMEGKLHIVDVFGAEDLVGWDQVREAAQEREAELGYWQAWNRNCAMFMDQASQALKRIEAHTPPDLASLEAIFQANVDALLRSGVRTYATPLAQRRDDWSAVQHAARQALGILDAGPQRDAQPVPIRSKRANDLSREGKRRRGIAQDWLNQATRRLSEIEADLADPQKRMPGPEEFADAVKKKEWPRLARLIERAKLAGPGNEQEQKRIQAYETTLKNNLGKPQKEDLWDRLRGKK